MNPLPTRHTNTRRQFLHDAALFGLAAGGASLATACAPLSPPAPGAESTVPPNRSTVYSEPAPSSQQQQEATANRVRVAFVKTMDRSEGVRRALALLDPLPLKGKHVLLKPNFNSADPAPGSTHPALLRTLVEELWRMQASAIQLADRSGMGATRRVMEELGVFALGKQLDFTTTVLDELGVDDWELVQPAESHWQRGFPMARCCLAADAVVQACCLKTHRYGGHFTLSLKNSVGLAAKRRPGDSHDYMNELHSSPHQRKMIAEINTAYAPALIVMDGVEAFVSGGPDNGKRLAANVVLASSDRIAIDAVGVALLRYYGTTPEVSAGPIFAQEQIARAVELDLGVSRAEQIELISDDAEGAAYAAEIGKILSQG